MTDEKRRARKGLPPVRKCEAAAIDDDNGYHLCGLPHGHRSKAHHCEDCGLRWLTGRGATPDQFV